MLITFHVLEKANMHAAQLFVCQLAETAHLENTASRILLGSSIEAKTLDQLLWTYKDDSFIPHQLEGENAASIYIGQPQQPVATLINMGNELPDDFLSYQRISEIVFNDPGMQQLARLRYKQYRDAGCQIATHKHKL